MNEQPEVKTGSRPALVLLAVLLVVVLTLLFVWLAHRGNVLQRQSEAQVAAQTEAAQQLQQPGPAPSPWQLQSRVPVALQEPTAIACSGDRVYVVGGESATSDALLVCDRSLKPLSRVALPGMPRGVAASNDAILTAFGARVARLDASGKALSDFGVAGERVRLSSVLPLGQELWVADSGQRAVWRYDASGKLLGKVGAPDPATGYPGLLVPSPHLDLALTPTGNVLINNPGKLRVETWSPQGKLTGQFGKPGMGDDGFAGCCNPIAVAALPDGRVVTAEKGLVRVKVYRADGTFESVVATPPVLSRGVASLDLATTADGAILVLDPRAKMILTFTENKASRPQGSH